MAELGFRKVNEMIGRTDMLKQKTDIDNWKAKKVDLSAILQKVPLGKNDSTYSSLSIEFRLRTILSCCFIKYNSPKILNKLGSLIR